MCMRANCTIQSKVQCKLLYKAAIFLITVYYIMYKQMTHYFTSTSRRIKCKAHSLYIVLQLLKVITYHQELSRTLHLLPLAGLEGEVWEGGAAWLGGPGEPHTSPQY